MVRPRNSGSRHGSTVALGNGVGLARLAETRCALRPIDHGFCLPEALEPPYLEWLHWPQVHLLLTVFLVKLVIVPQNQSRSEEICLELSQLSHPRAWGVNT